MRELKSIYDLLDVSYMVLSLNGAASFSRARRYDGKMIYFKEKGDMTMAIVLNLICIVGYIMMFLYSPYVILTSTTDNLLYKGMFLVVVGAGIISRTHAAFRSEMFLRCLELIDEIDDFLKKNRRNVHYNDLKMNLYMVGTIPMFVVILFIRYYYDDTMEEDDSLFEIVHMSFSYNLSCCSIASQSFISTIIAKVIRKTFQHLNDYLDILKNVKNPKIVEQELLKVSNIHFKICLSWKLSLEAYGLSQVMVLILTYTYCAVLVALTGYILPALKKESIIPTIGLIAYCLYSIQKFQNLKNTADEFKSRLIELCMKRKTNENVHMMCKTLLLQIEHWNIDLVIGGFITMDLISFLEGLKSVSTVFMFLIQMKTE